MWSVTTVRWGLHSVFTHTHGVHMIGLGSVRCVIYLFRLLWNTVHAVWPHTSDRAQTHSGAHPLSRTDTVILGESCKPWDETRLLFCSGECESPLQSAVEWMRHTQTEKKHTDGYQPKVRATLWLIDKAHSSVELWTPLGACCLNQTCEIPVILPLISVRRVVVQVQQKPFNVSCHAAGILHFFPCILNWETGVLVSTIRLTSLNDWHST